MSDRLYTLKELSELSGYCVPTLLDMIHAGELVAVRRGTRGWFRVSPSAWEAWKASHNTAASQPIVVELNPPKHAPVVTRKPVDVSELLPKGFKSPFAKSA